MGKKRITTTPEGETAAASDAVNSTSKKSAKKQVINGVAHVSVSYNNTLICVTDTKGDVVSWASAGSLGFKGTKKSTPYAANLVAKTVLERAARFNLTNLKVVVKGIGPGRESAVRGLAGTGLNIISIQDNTPIAHNGVRKRKPRRV